MGWEQRRSGTYFYTAERVGGRVVKRYVGTGKVAELAAQLEAATSAQKAADAERQRREREQLDALDESLNALHELADTLTDAALVAAGFHRHHRGPWRKRRA
jgi:hypothetical protein